jgi:EpsI family protein
MQQRPIWFKFIYVLFAFIIGIFANGLRVALIGIWTLYKGADFVHGPFEIFYVSFILFFGLSLILIANLFSRKKGLHKAKINELRAAKIGLINFYECHTFPLAIAFAVLFVTSIYLFTYKPVAVSLAMPLQSFPKEINGWQGEEVENNDWPFKNLSAHASLKRKYYDSSKYEIGLYIGYYLFQNQEKEIINDRFIWLYNQATDQPLKIGSKILNINKGLPRGLADQTYQGDRRSFYFWYEIDRKIMTGRYTTKFATLLNSLINRRSDGAIVVVTVNDRWDQNKEANDHAVEFIQAVFPYIQKHLKTAD